MLSRMRWSPSVLPGLVAIAFIWIWLAPVQLGGQVSYVILSGNSMEPDFHRGDLVLARQAGEYRVGDIIAYHHPDIGLVFHRIVAQDANTYTLKGDHNTWEDSFYPDSADILGKFWFFLPKVGNWLEDLHNPLPMTILSLGIAIAFISILTSNDQLKTLKRKRFYQQGKKGHSIQMGSGINSKLDWLLVPGSVFMGALLLGYFAFTHPLTQTISDDINYQQLGYFGYSAIAPAGVYDTETVQTGEPVFSQIACNVNLNFIYILAATTSEQLVGTYQINAILSDTNGWKRTIPLAVATEFSGNSFWTSSELDLCQVQAMIGQMQEITGIDHNFYSLDVHPDISIQGALAEKLFSDEFSPHLMFQLDPLQMQLTRLDGDDNPLQPIQAGTISGSSQIANNLSIFGFELDVLLARRLALILMACSVAAGLLLGLPIWWEWRQDEINRTQILYAPLLVEVKAEFQNQNLKTIEVSRIEDLVKMAEKYGSMIMHKAIGLTHMYWVPDGEFIYRYSIQSKGRAWELGSAQILKNDLAAALKSGELLVHYQPVVSLETGKIIAVEALARWQHPKYGSIPPSTFIPVAEEQGIIEDLDEWVLRTACAQIKSWQEAGLPLVNLSVNLSPSGLKRQDVSQLISEVLDQTQISPQRLLLEVTKSKILSSEPEAVERLHDLHELGVQLGLDEFSQLSSEGLSLNDFSMIKINQEVLGSAYKDRAIADLVTAMIIMAQKMKMQVFAKGIETEEQLGLIRAQRFDGAQGYLLSKPLPAEEVTELLTGGIQIEALESGFNRMRINEQSV